MLLFIYVLLFVSVLAKHEDYKGYRVYNIEFFFEEQEDNFYKLKSDLIDFWKKPSLKYGVIGKAMVPPSHFDWFEEKLVEIEVKRDVFIEDVYEFLNKNAEESTKNREIDSRDFSFDAFHRYDVILDHLYSLQEVYANSATDFEVIQYGITAENRPLVYVKITNRINDNEDGGSNESSNENASPEVDSNGSNSGENSNNESNSEESNGNASPEVDSNGNISDENNNGNEVDSNQADGNGANRNNKNAKINKKMYRNQYDNNDKPVVIVEAGINPREWITIPSALNVIYHLLEGDQKFLDETIWIIVPVLNPDGYEYTHTNLRLWTKSLSLNSHLGFICPGVHLNRNFDIDWQISDSSSSPCSHLYAGINPFSEVETQMIRHILDEYNPILYITLQNNGKFVTYPWAFEKAATGLFKRHYLLGLDVVNVLDGYVLDSRAIALGDRESGTSADYARMSTKSFYTYSIGIEGAGEDGVIVAEENIRTLVEDVWRAVEVTANGVLNN